MEEKKRKMNSSNCNIQEVLGLEGARMGREGKVSLSQTLRFGIAGFLLNCHQLLPTLKGD